MASSYFPRVDKDDEVARELEIAWTTVKGAGRAKCPADCLGQQGKDCEHEPQCPLFRKMPLGLVNQNGAGVYGNLECGGFKKGGGPLLREKLTGYQGSGDRSRLFEKRATYLASTESTCTDDENNENSFPRSISKMSNPNFGTDKSASITNGKSDSDFGVQQQLLMAENERLAKLKDQIQTDNFKYKLQQSMDLAIRLKEERDHLERCRDETDRRLKERQVKYQSLLIEMNKLKIGEDTKLANAKASLQVKCFELDRTRLILEDCQEKHRSAVSQNQELKSKIETLYEDFNNTKCEMQTEITRLSLELHSKNAKLGLYEQIEDALDEMILKAASVPNEDIGNNFLSFCSSGPSLPTDSRRRLQQAFDLAKKNCELEKTVAEQKKEILELYDERQMLRQEVQTVKSLNGFSVSQLVETITAKNREINKLKKRIEEIDRKFRELEYSKAGLAETLGNYKDYHDQVHKVYHSRARIEEWKRDGDKHDIQPSISVPTKSSSDVVTTKSIMHLQNRKFGPTRSDLTSSKMAYNAGRTTTKYEPLKTCRSQSAPITASKSVFVVTKKIPVFERDDDFPALSTITEEPTYPSDFTDVSTTTSSLSIVPDPPPRKTVISSYGVSIRKLPPYPAASSSSSKIPSFVSSSTRIPSVESSSTATGSKLSQAMSSKLIPGRQVASADLITEHTKNEKKEKKEKLVPLRKSKVRPSTSTIF